MVPGRIDGDNRPALIQDRDMGGQRIERGLQELEGLAQGGVLGQKLPAIV